MAFALEKYSNSTLTLEAIGEKELIRDIITPLFNPKKLKWGVGDDCALIEPSAGMSLLISTDRVPADLTAFRFGILDYRGLGRYLACLNLSDIAASGGKPKGLLLNLGLPKHFFVRDLIALLLGAFDLTSSHGCGILGGDLSDASELTISATAVGEIERSRALSRQTAKAGDLVFISRPLGLTPAAFRYLRNRQMLDRRLASTSVELLMEQFTKIGPMFSLSAELATSGECSSCMDNTDGIGQSLSELAESSNVAVIVDLRKLEIPTVVRQIADYLGEDPLRLAFAAGADFSLVGTIASLGKHFPSDISVIGHVEPGHGVFMDSGLKQVPLIVEGWNYYSPSAIKDE